MLVIYERMARNSYMKALFISFTSESLLHPNNETPAVYFREYNRTKKRISISLKHVCLLVGNRVFSKHLTVFNFQLVDNQTNFPIIDTILRISQCLRDKVMPSEITSPLPIESPKHTNGMSIVKTQGLEVCQI